MRTKIFGILLAGVLVLGSFASTAEARLGQRGWRSGYYYGGYGAYPAYRYGYPANYGGFYGYPAYRSYYNAPYGSYYMPYGYYGW